LDEEVLESILVDQNANLLMDFGTASQRLAA